MFYIKNKNFATFKYQISKPNEYTSSTKRALSGPYEPVHVLAGRRNGYPLFTSRREYIPVGSASASMRRTLVNNEHPFLPAH